MSDPLVSIITIALNTAVFCVPPWRAFFTKLIEHRVHHHRRGSTDGSLDIIRSYASRIAFWSSEPDSGPARLSTRGSNVRPATFPLAQRRRPPPAGRRVHRRPLPGPHWRAVHLWPFAADRRIGRVIKNLYTSPQSYRSYRFDNGGNVFQERYFQKGIMERFGPLDPD